jgi:hypothetical protein
VLPLAMLPLLPVLPLAMLPLLPVLPLTMLPLLPVPPLTTLPLLPVLPDDPVLPIAPPPTVSPGMQSTTGPPSVPSAGTVLATPPSIDRLASSALGTPGTHKLVAFWEEQESIVSAAIALASGSRKQSGWRRIGPRGAVFLGLGDGPFGARHFMHMALERQAFWRNS